MYIPPPSQIFLTLLPTPPFSLLQVIGATVGRLIGEVLAVNLSESRGVVPSTFALVGAAAMSCGATQTISAAVVSFSAVGRSMPLESAVECEGGGGCLNWRRALAQSWWFCARWCFFSQHACMLRNQNQMSRLTQRLYTFFYLAFIVSL